MPPHPLVGSSIIQNIDSEDSHEVALVVRHHHERYDGLGYPDGLKGDAIPSFSRLIAICDTFDAMTSRRPYRAPLPLHFVQETLLAESGRQFSPPYLEAFLKLVDDGEIQIPL
mgnify:CR=1 FL=1